MISSFCVKGLTFFYYQYITFSDRRNNFSDFGKPRQSSTKKEGRYTRPSVSKENDNRYLIRTHSAVCPFSRKRKQIRRSLGWNTIAWTFPIFEPGLQCRAGSKRTGFDFLFSTVMASLSVKVYVTLKRTWMKIDSGDSSPVTKPFYPLGKFSFRSKKSMDLAGFFIKYFYFFCVLHGLAPFTVIISH
jgi:hypothetical protein